jgi:Tripartite tricarboxylate transporter family receptor
LHQPNRSLGNELGSNRKPAHALIEPPKVRRGGRKPLADPSESGVCARAGVANFDAGAWFSFALPNGAPAAIVQKLHNATVAAMSAPATEERLKEFGSILIAPERRSPEYLQKFIQSEIDKWAALITAANINDSVRMEFWQAVEKEFATVRMSDIDAAAMLELHD